MLRIEDEHYRRIHELKGGKEHIVFIDPHDEETIVKYPRPYNKWLLFHFFGGTQTIVKEVIETQKQVAVSDGLVQIPETFIFNTHTSYMMRQKRVREDGSVPDIKMHLGIFGLSELEERYTSNPRNFISENGIVYVVDPTKVWMHIAFDMLPFKPGTYRKITNRIIKVQDFLRRNR